MKNIKTKTRLIIILFFALSFTSCENYSLTGIKGDGSVVTNHIEQLSIEGIIIEIPANVYISKGVTESIQIDAQQNIFDNIETIVNNGILTLKFKQNVRKSEDINVYLSMDQLKELSISGTGDIYTDSSFTTDEKLILNISGSGNIDVEANASEVEINISGSGDIKLKTVTQKISSNISGSGDIFLIGESTGSAWYHTSGSGNINAFDFESKYCSVNVVGSGISKLFATESLDVKISGSGDVYYKGRPSISVDISGSGTVISAN